MKVKLLKVVFVIVFIFVCMSFVSQSFAIGVDYVDGTLSNNNIKSFGGGNKASNVIGVTNNVWTTAKYVIQIVAVAIVVIAGLRYMFASADARADIKRQTITLIVGAVLVFGAVQIVSLVAKATEYKKTGDTTSIFRNSGIN